MSGDRIPTYFPFEHAADELRQQELTRLADAVPPALEALRSLTPAPFRAEIALMLEEGASRADELAAGGNHSEVAVWRRISVAVAELVNTTPPGPVH
jgi:hypothetical protein